MLRREYRGGTDLLNMKAMLKLVNYQNESAINYVKLKYILRVLNELHICDVEELNNDIYSFKVIFNAAKTNIEKSSILKKLRNQCFDHSSSKK